MDILNTVEELKQALNSARNEGKSIGFVPTMGALHQGHMDLVSRASVECDIVVASVFVNPTQFNNTSDLELYPRTPEADSELLKKFGCDIAFFPSVAEIYPENSIYPQVDLGSLDQVMEGKFRPGHFNGVVQVVWRLFDIVQPQKAFFGLKDFQQVAVIQRMVEVLDLPVQIVPCETLRTEKGLAMSSRNKRLSEGQKEEALIIYKTLSQAKEDALTLSPAQTLINALSNFETGSLKLEYLNIIHPKTLEDLTTEWVPGATMCIACFCGEVRLIDNLTLL
ncbi:pantoate--beta-alanine ligase [Fluviicola taffensis]|uniref:Pantothenate synthetase n=1 Tax=Fluviicola taffensis (strain DSM 16823 / NCIMB 13979 / RW262) TaxID=755732 RepID=F2IJK5_FLUTR|nr:pantoate--beta-alanine ligase [Fluviicola taffensis]AEA42893.1 pantothenate synthetase [Fluviicola taffensis DSM 16823]